jgi:hypothetical protein
VDKICLHTVFLILIFPDGNVVIIYHIFDNNAYFCVDDDGSKSFPSKTGGGDSVYHVIGRLEVADQSVVKSLVNMSVGLVRAGGEAEKLCFRHSRDLSFHVV